jgi:putative FmdB family regulatory protein
MPTYAYRREDGSTFDYFQKMSDAPLAACPTTGQHVTRIISGGAGVVYKGEGWYVKEYKKSSAAGSTSSSPASTAASAPAETTAPAAAGCAHNDCSCAS